MSIFHQTLLESAPHPTFSDRESQTIATAAVISLLTYSANPTAELQRRDAQHSFIDYNTITKLWPLQGSDGGILVAWSAPLDTCFVAFRGSSTLSDWRDTNLRSARTLDDANNWGVHEGFQRRAAGLPLEVISQLVYCHNTVLCGHSLGGALATLAGLAIPPQALGNNPQDAWSDSSDATSHMSVVTFGAPSVLVRNRREFAEPPREIRRLIHNVIDPDDIVPTAFNRARDCLRTVAAALEGLGSPPDLPMPMLLLRTALGISDTLASGAFAAGAIRLILAALRLCPLDDDSYGTHVGNIILVCGQNSFIRMCEDNKPLCLAALSREMDARSPEAAQKLANHHKMLSYCIKWETFCINKHNQLWTTLKLQPAHLVPDAIVPYIELALSQAVQDPVTQSINFALRFGDNRATHAYSHAVMRYTEPHAERDEVCRAELDIICAASIEIRFSFGIANRRSNSAMGRVGLWKALFEATKTVALVDIFGRHHPVTLYEDILYPDLTTTRHQSTTEFVKTAMLRAVALQVAFAHENNPADNTPQLCPEVLPIVMLVDRAVQSSNIQRFFERFDYSFEAVECTWKSAFEDNDTDQAIAPHHAPQNDADHLRANLIPKGARGRLRTALMKLISNAVPDDAVPGDFQSDPRDSFSSVPETPLLSDVLLSYTNSGENKEGSFTDLRTSLIVMSLIIQTQIDIRSEDVFTAIAPSMLHRCGAVAGMVLGVATALLFPPLWAAGIGAAMISGTSLYSHRPRPELAYDQVLCSAVEQLRVSNGLPMTTASAEIALAPFADRSIAQIEEVAASTNATWPEGFAPSPYYYQLIQFVALIGSLRTLVTMKPSIGTFGPVRSGKSQLLTTVFRLLESIFSPGTLRRNRTLHFRTTVTATGLISDGPGLDERDVRLHEASRLLLDLLDVIIVVVNFSLVEADSTDKLVKTLALLLERRNGQPVCILLNRVDETITDQTIENHRDWLDNVHDQKVAFVRQLQEALKRPYLEIVTSAQHPDPDQAHRRFVRRATVPLEDIVHVSCLINYENSPMLAPKRPVLRALKAQNGLWGTEDVRRWIHDVCPEAMPNP